MARVNAWGLRFLRSVPQGTTLLFKFESEVGVPAATVTYLALRQGLNGLDQIIKSVNGWIEEAAKVDGATAWQRFRFVTWPTIRGAAALAIVLQTLWAVKEFDIIYATTGGGPARATQTLSLLVYEEAFQFFRFGYASAVGMLLLAACAILSFLSIRWSRPPGS